MGGTRSPAVLHPQGMGQRLSRKEVALSPKLRVQPLIMHLLLPVLLQACDSINLAPTEVEVVADTSTVTLALRNPTQDADPLASITSLRVDVKVDGVAMVSESFDWPLEDGASAIMEHLTEYGIVRFEVAGISGGQVLSFGRSAEMVIPPGEDIRVPITFLPINTAFALTEEMQGRRSRHMATRRPDGTILLVGGHSAEGGTTFDDLEVFDGASFTLSHPSGRLPEAAAAPAGGWLEDGTLLLVGGESRASAGGVGTQSISLYDPVDETVEQVASLGVPRQDHCAAHYIPSGFWVLGGPGSMDIDGSYGDLVRESGSGDGWNDELVTLRGSINSAEVTACIADESSGKVYVQGKTALSTGVWDVRGGAVAAGEAFQAISGNYGDAAFLWHPIVRIIEPGTVWIAGGGDFSEPQYPSSTEGREFRMDSGVFVRGNGLTDPRQSASVDDWIVDGWLVVGCGFTDYRGITSSNSVEILDPLTGDRGPQVQLDRDRPGCQVSTLLDGSILVTGGFGPTSTPGDATMAIIVPWWST